MRLAVDIGGTFTDLVLESAPGVQHAAKVLTTPQAPEVAVVEGVKSLLERCAVAPQVLTLMMHGTTLATNAIIERKGAKTALITTDGFRDVLAIADEGRFDQYDLMIDKPQPLVPRYLRFGVPERMSVDGSVLRVLDESAVERVAEQLKTHAVQSVAVGFLHGYRNPEHELKVRHIIHNLVPDITVTLASEVCPEIREYERLSTATANAYVQPLMASYLTRLSAALSEIGVSCPVLLMTSGGGLTTLETAIKFPIRLVESGPAAGAILASAIAESYELDQVLSFDMGGTTAKICLIHDGQAQSARTFEVDRAARFMKGSGLPLRIPVVEMVEIGAGGGSIAKINALNQIAIGPESAGSDPGPVCYGRGAQQPTITDADLVLGKIDPDDFAGGTMSLDTLGARVALDRMIGSQLSLSTEMSAYGICELVDETMSNAARVHTVEKGRVVAEHTLIAFGGAAPLHAARLAEKLSINKVLVPRNAGVGSAVGLLKAPIGYEVVRSRYLTLRDFDAPSVNTLFDELYDEAESVVAAAGRDGRTVTRRLVYMRYVGQGHEIAVELPNGRFADDGLRLFRDLFEVAYAAQYARTIPGAEIEVLTWTLTLTLANTPVEPRWRANTSSSMIEKVRQVFDARKNQFVEVAVYQRDELVPDCQYSGPCVIVETDTSTFVTDTFDAHIDSQGAIVLEKTDRV